MTEPVRLEGFPGRYWHRLEDGRIQCDVCPRYCRLNEGQRGLCFVRGRQDDRIVLTTYGRSSGFCVDPIEKKPLNHYLPGTPVLSFGTAGCNLTCKFCQNWDISKARELDRLQDTAAPEDIVEAAIATGSRSIAYTYNDPVIFLEYAVDVAKVARRRGIKNVAVTAGYIDAAAREELYTFMDAANVDLKAFTEEFYKRLCTGHLGAVLETLEYLKYRTKVWFEITTLLIPGHNDSPEEVKTLSEWVMTRLGPDVPLHFTAFHPDYKMLDLPRTPASTLTTARDIARKVGLHFVYTGNVHDEMGQSTYCPGCGQAIIGRDWYDNHHLAAHRGWPLRYLLYRNTWLVRGAPGQLGTAARPDPDRQTGMRLSKDDAGVEAPHLRRPRALRAFGLRNGQRTRLEGRLRDVQGTPTRKD